jgi:hypothetical protein
LCEPLLPGAQEVIALSQADADLPVEQPLTGFTLMRMVA